MAISALYASGVLLLAFYILKTVFSPWKKNSLPPGPRPIPIIGNIAHLPARNSQEWRHWLKYKERYGDIFSITVMGQTLIIVHDKNAVIQLMEKRAMNYSDRPCGFEEGLPTFPYGDKLRRHRKYFHSQMGTKQVLRKYDPAIDLWSSRFLLLVLEDPKKLADHVRAEKGATVLDIAYGYTITPHTKDPLIDRADHVMKLFSEAIVPGAYLVDIIPALKYFPAWLPGMEFKNKARNMKRITHDMMDKPYRFVTHQMSNGSASPSFVSDTIEQKGSKLSAEDEYEIKWAASTLYAGGADTSVATMLSFFLAMSIWPEVQIKAREELDRVVGTVRLPTMADRDNLPYLNAIVQEAFRWHTVAPMGNPHTAKTEDVYEGYRIPKGAMIIPAIWWFTHDPEVYHDPMEFKPERFLEPYNEPDPANLIFGFGRRICPGRLLADATVYMTIAKSLAAFEIKKAIDVDGNEIEPVVEFGGGLISQVRPFDCRIIVRTKEYEEVIRRVDVEYPWVEGSAMEQLEEADV